MSFKVALKEVEDDLATVFQLQFEKHYFVPLLFHAEVEGAMSLIDDLSCGLVNDGCLHEERSGVLPAIA